MLMVFLIIVPLLVAVVTMTVWWLPGTAIALGGLAFLGLGSVSAWKEEQDPFWYRRRCATCGETVPEESTICRRCGSADVLDQSLHMRRNRPWERRRQQQEAAERSRAIEREHGVYAPFWKLVGWYVRFITGGMGMDPDDPSDMRWWAACMLLIAGLFWAVGTAAEFGGWAIAAPVLFASLSSSFAVATLGPRSMAER
jgi:hypothetical protein